MPWELFEKGRRYLNNEALIQGDEGRAVIKGCCAKKYEVAFGYDHLMSIFENQDMITNICGGNLSSLPNPEILAINCKSTQSFGSYDSRGACYGWDSNDAQRKSLIRKVMKEDGILDKVNERGKDALKKLLIAFCER